MKNFTRVLVLVCTAILSLSVLLSSCDETGDETTKSVSTSNITIEETDSATAPIETTEAPKETTVYITEEATDSSETDGEKYPKEFDANGNLIVYWLNNGTVWHESAKCSTVTKSDPAIIHNGSAYEAYSSGKERACKICSSDSTVVIPETIVAPETTSTPETTRAPETTITPETTRVPETTKEPETTQIEETKYPKTYNEKGELVVFWFNSGSAWHESKKCGVIAVSFFLNLNEGSVSEAYSNGKTYACKICSSDSTVIIPEITTAPETTNSPETTRVPETTNAPETTRVPETTKAPETTRVPDTTSAPETTLAPETTSVPETTSAPETTKTPETEVGYPSDLDSNRTIYWIDTGYVWHYSINCWTLDNTPRSDIHTGVSSDAYAAGMLRSCKVCADGGTIDPPETTAEPEITTTPEDTSSPSSKDELVIISWPKTAYRNEYVSVSIKGKANTKYYIEVNYKTGPSTSKDLEPQTSDSSGEVTWTWKVGARSSAGTFDIIVKDDNGNSVTVEWTVVVD